MGLSNAAGAADAPVPMQQLLDGGFKVVSSVSGRLILQKDAQVYSCGYDIAGPQQTVAGDLIHTKYACLLLH